MLALGYLVHGSLSRFHAVISLPARSSYETVRATGCTLSVSFFWSCFVDSSSTCHPQIQVTRTGKLFVCVSSDQGHAIFDAICARSLFCAFWLQVSRMDLNERRRGFEYQYANYYRPAQAGLETRDLYTVRGVRCATALSARRLHQSHSHPRVIWRSLLLSSRGEGKRVSISAIMLQVCALVQRWVSPSCLLPCSRASAHAREFQISSGIALLWLANFAADFLMLHVLPERKHYRTYKQERTPDFSDLRTAHNVARTGAPMRCF